MTEADFVSLFQMIPLIGKTVYNASGTITPVWGDSCILAYVNPSLQPTDGQSDMTVGRTIVCDEYSVVEYDAPEKDHRGAQWIECQYGFAHQFIGVDNATDGDTIAAYLIDNAI